MSEINNGGPAFPSHGTMGEVTHEGMTLRDYFAAKAMAAIIAQPEGGLDYEEDTVAAAAFEMADAMLRARGAA
ncbi:hypothetical protein [Pandoraea commovens]|uniref:Gp38 n=1 Tax=Pandoraea commovens TaxID=2508289 RepID=A0A5E4XBZ5_9BURK|nr:hypothetical protein [Pandoraea commovens]VVE33722.1 gp38 [Pandoraea commovens]